MHNNMMGASFEDPNEAVSFACNGNLRRVCALSGSAHRDAFTINQ